MNNGYCPEQWHTGGLTAVVDLQGFWINGQFVIKVLTVIRVKGDAEERVVRKFVFRPPRPFRTLNTDDKSQVWWIKRCHHATPPWSSGSYDYRDRDFVIRKALEGVRTLYVKGGQKEKWLQEYIFEEKQRIFDLESFGCPPLNECLRAYRELYACDDVSLAGQHVIALYEWMSVNRPDLLHHEAEWREREIVVLRRSHPLIRSVADVLEHTSQEIEQETRENINRAFRKFREADYTLTLLDSETLSQLPVEFLCHWLPSHEVERVFEKLPEDIKKLPCVQELRSCKEHWNRGRTRIDGPPPSKRNCRFCITLRQPCRQHYSEDDDDAPSRNECPSCQINDSLVCTQHTTTTSHHGNGPLLLKRDCVFCKRNIVVCVCVCGMKCIDSVIIGLTLVDFAFVIAAFICLML